MLKSLSFTLAIFLFCIITVLSAASIADARSDQRVRGYSKKDGSYVQPYTRTSPDRTRNNNYSTRGNTNPYTGKAGTKPRDEDYRPRSTKSKSGTYRGF